VQEGLEGQGLGFTPHPSMRCARASKPATVPELATGSCGIGHRFFLDGHRDEATDRLPVQSEALDVNLSVEETMVEAAPDAKINDIKALLGRMMFSGKSMGKRVRTPSWP